MLARLAGETFDFLIVGGGATGLGCAVDAASRGYRTALVEANDFAAATSSRSTKLVHGGVRYLAQGDLHLVREALHERSRLLRNAPCLVRDRTFVTPAYRWYEPPYYLAGLKLYDVLAGANDPFGRSTFLSANAALARLPWLRAGGLRGAIAYHDGQFDDARLAIALARTAADRGAALANYVRCTALADADSNSGLRRIALRDEETGDALDARAKVVVNAAGIFVDEIRRLEDPTAEPMMALSRGTHIAIAPETLPGNDALLIPNTIDGRVAFAIPWHERTLVGTTDIPTREALLDPTPTAEEIDYLLMTLNRYTRTAVARDRVTA
ncbi:MAG: glycerol-3-phosphate dehydrogenase/oxidase, partial [Candidatus Eremiobacteraeota bacterium]|nr:glycerol-3-phosphate dehydrogenase/oxidase [Candidatus Eremiobacteraeota bacterium]